MNTKQIEFIIRWRVNEFLDSIVVRNTIWGAHRNPKGHRCNGGTRRFPVGEKSQTSPRKNHFSVKFVHSRSIHKCREILRDPRKLHRAIRNTRRGQPTTGVCLLRDNARPRTARKSVENLNNFGWEILNSPAYVVPTRRQMILFISPFSKDRKRWSTDEEVQCTNGQGRWRPERVAQEHVSSSVVRNQTVFTK